MAAHFLTPIDDEEQCAFFFLLPLVLDSKLIFICQRRQTDSLGDRDKASMACVRKKGPHLYSLQGGNAFGNGEGRCHALPALSLPSSSGRTVIAVLSLPLPRLTR